MIDADKSGTITTKEFAAALRRKGSNLPEEEVQQLVQDADIDGDGMIDYEVSPETAALLFATDNFVCAHHSTNGCPS